MTRAIITHALALYLGAGLFNGLLMAQVIPPMNALGVAWITVAWPRVIYCAPASRGCDMVPAQINDLIYTFDGEPR